ncbi:ribosome biogenesis GTPase Der [Candidatus Kuenenbacteria bacterium HGW-Kuenenbacteria-1]|uniref:GTPase Der n=1 Tax=Candidatus Kuenenbacteria bacterium HGW-Kuenenbacteria-1 TaxID=2013812 RepID=A0A2N1UPD0_9BACT|nr:MAG: ribosome biogenesis GTPase Der [Candidatus Kuenenbacteria bacterium HGW-Kuenenbacteria-1]
MKVCIIGRVNVGKSTLFNRLIDQEKAIISKIAGTTRDRNYAECFWRKEKFDLIDTGGLQDAGINKVEKKVQEQTQVALKEADLILFVVDVKDGLLLEDKDIAKILRNLKKPIIVAVNKVDKNSLRKMASDFFKLGFGEPMLISAITGIGTGDLLDEIVKKLFVLPKIKSDENIIIKEPIKKPVKIILTGRTNVGKSSIFNAILGEERVIVSEIPHTTREALDTLITYKNQSILIVDTAGLRKKSKIDCHIEKIGSLQSLQTFKRADVICLVLEAGETALSQDKRIANHIERTNKGVIIVVNKWDLLSQKDKRKVNQYIQYLKAQFSFFLWAPIVFVSAKENFQIKKILDTALKIKQRLNRIFDQKELDKFLEEMKKKYSFFIDPSERKLHPKTVKQKFFSVYKFSQIRDNPPKFALVIQQKTPLPQACLNILEKELRKKFDFEGIPFTIELEKPE